MSQFDEFLKEVEGLTEKEIKVLVVTGKPGSGKSKVLREAAETKGWDYIDTRLLITEDFLKLLPSERRVNAPEVLKNELLSHHGDVVMLDRIQTLFIPVFNIDPKSVLDELGRAFTVVIAWPGYTAARRPDELYETAKELQVPYDLVLYVHDHKKLPVVNFAAGGVATPADAALMMQLGAEGVFVGSGIFKSGNPAKRAAAIVKAVTNYNDPEILAKLSEDLGEAMVGINENEIKLIMAERGQ